MISVRQEKGHNSGHCYCHQCDCELGGWYRFADSIGGQINEHSMPGGWRCGTAYAGWLSGSHPTRVGKQVSAK